jgi:hypothetical protein
MKNAQRDSVGYGSRGHGVDDFGACFGDDNLFYI